MFVDVYCLLYEEPERAWFFPTPHWVKAFPPHTSIIAGRAVSEKSPAPCYKSNRPQVKGICLV